ncbi:MAG: HAMP domain-containing histidine kinase [Lachnospiraceae bacterium]|nr:HAMP domain-containing histidine kinase [Lachnospiraceae bacterium]
MKYILLIVIAILLLLLIYVSFRLIVIKHNLRGMRKELEKTKEESYNRNLRVTLLDRDLEKLAAEINSNIEYQKNLKLETAKSRKQLEQSISDIAHDLRTPLTVIKGNLQLLENEEMSDKGKQYLDVSSKKAESLKGMVDEFFELSVLESDSKPVELTKTDIITLLSEFIIENESIIRNKGLTPNINFPENTIYVEANAALLNRVFSNLIGNIVKYAKGDFELSVSADDKTRCIIKIGNEIENKDAIDTEHIFDRTYRADKARSDGSAGLGLYIARLLMEKQKGNIEAVIEGDKLFFILSLQRIEK